MQGLLPFRTLTATSRSISLATGKQACVPFSQSIRPITWYLQYGQGAECGPMRRIRRPMADALAIVEGHDLQGRAGGIWHWAAVEVT